jgi:hypothetical protein
MSYLLPVPAGPKLVAGGSGQQRSGGVVDPVAAEADDMVILQDLGDFMG